jgi:hypothetical protein
LEASPSIINQRHPDDATLPQPVEPAVEEAFDDFFAYDATAEEAELPPEAEAEPEEIPEAAPESPQEASGAFEEAQEALDPLDSLEALSEAQEGSEAGKQGGELSREYLVFRQMYLTATVLRGLLDQVEQQGRAPRLGYFELHRMAARTPHEAVVRAFAAHHHHLDSRWDLAVVSARSFRIRHVEPEMPEAPRLKIT